MKETEVGADARFLKLKAEELVERLKTAGLAEPLSATKDDEQKAIARFKAAKEAFLERFYYDGEKVGLIYVLLHADLTEMEELECWDKKHGISQGVPLNGITFTDVAYAMSEDWVLETKADVRECCEQRDTDWDNPIWIQGFVIGALGAFNFLKPRFE